MLVPAGPPGREEGHVAIGDCFAAESADPRRPIGRFFVGSVIFRSVGAVVRGIGHSQLGPVPVCSLLRFGFPLLSAKPNRRSS